MDKRTINIFVSIVLLVAFFMPWITFMGIGGSPYQMIKELIKQVSKNIEYVEREPTILLALLLLIFPICAVLILYFYSKNVIKKKSISTIQFAKKLPLIFIIIVIVYGVIKMGNYAEMLLDDAIFEVIGAGLILTIISSIILFFNETLETVFTQNNHLKREEQKEEANIDDLFK